VPFAVSSAPCVTLTPQFISDPDTGRKQSDFCHAWPFYLFLPMIMEVAIVASDFTSTGDSSNQLEDVTAPESDLPPFQMSMKVASF